jgi:stearoyl-CoA desaturase (delta-9 desaturase)
MTPTIKSRVESVLMLIGVTLPFLATLFAIVLLWQRMVTWRELTLMGVMYVLTGLGITMGYHRMLTHRSFEAHPVVKFLLLVLGSMGIEGPPHLWAATHIKHHARTDQEDDPHTPLQGFWHAHMGWFVGGMKTEDVYGKWLEKDRMVMFVSRAFPVLAVLTFVLPFAAGGLWSGTWRGAWFGLLWGGLVRVFLCHHVTWSINSVCHVWGRRMFETQDVSKNNWIFGVLGFGEGWHNNHHAFPRSAFHGLRWWQIDISAYLIRLMERVRLARNVWRIPADRFEARLIRRKASSSAPPAVRATTGVEG